MEAVEEAGCGADADAVEGVMEGGVSVLEVFG